MRLCRDARHRVVHELLVLPLTLRSSTSRDQTVIAGVSRSDGFKLHACEGATHAMLHVRSWFPAQLTNIRQAHHRKTPAAASSVQ
jgi:hypothetical protein